MSSSNVIEIRPSSTLDTIIGNPNLDAIISIRKSRERLNLDERKIFDTVFIKTVLGEQNDIKTYINILKKNIAIRNYNLNQLSDLVSDSETIRDLDAFNKIFTLCTHRDSITFSNIMREGVVIHIRKSKFLKTIQQLYSENLEIAKFEVYLSFG